MVMLFMRALVVKLVVKRHEHLVTQNISLVSGKSADLYDRDNPDWVPSLNMKGPDASRSHNPSDIGRYERRISRKRKRIDERRISRKRKRTDDTAAESSLELQDTANDVQEENEEKGGSEHEV